jgi:oligogalacturonide lyase
MFCHEGPWQLVDSRIWFIDPDGAHLREAKKRKPDQPPGLDKGELWGHEFWLADSSRAGFIYFPLKFGIDATIRLLDPETLDETILMPVSPYSHFIFNRKNTHIIGDGKQPLADAIYLADIESQKESVLCRHGSSMKPYINLRTGRPNTQEVHPHPCFSPDGKKVLFTSDLHETPAVYLISLDFNSS